MLSSVLKTLRRDEPAPRLSRAQFLGLMASGIVAAGSGMLPAGRAAAETAPDLSPVDDLDGVYDAWQARFNAGDLDGLMALYVPDVTYINPDGTELPGAEATRADYAALLALKPQIEIGDRRHVVYQDISLTTNHWTLRLPAADGSFEVLTGGGIEVVRKHAGAGWQFIIDDASRSAT